MRICIKKLNYPNLIVETVPELHDREESEKAARLKLRIKLLRLLKSRETKTMRDTCRICGITPKHGYYLLAKYLDEGLNEYLQLNWKPRRSRLSDEQQEKLVARANVGRGFGTQAEAERFIFKEFAVSYTQVGVSQLFKRLKIETRGSRRLKKKASVEKQVAY